MANPIIVPKKSTVSSKVPITSDLALGEIAINHADKKLYARHPITGAVQEIGNLTAHSHDQLISIDSTADLELQNNGSVIITDGAIPTTLALSSTSARTITLPDKTGIVALLDDISGGGGGGGVTVSSTAPVSPSEGDLWLDSDTFELFVYYDNAWVELIDTAHTHTFPIEIGLAASDETTALTTGAAKVTFRAPCAMTLTAVRASVTTAPVGSTIIVDINENGTSILSTKLSIDASEKTSTTAATAAVISDSSIADDAEITIDIDQVGSTTAGKGLKVWLIGTR